MSAPKELWWCPENNIFGGTRESVHDDCFIERRQTVCPGSGREVRFVPAEPVVAWKATWEGIASVTQRREVAEHWASRGYKVERLVSAG